MSGEKSSSLNSEQDLASIPTAQGGLTRLAFARFEGAGVPVAPLLKRVELAPEHRRTGRATECAKPNHAFG